MFWQSSWILAAAVGLKRAICCVKDPFPADVQCPNLARVLLQLPTLLLRMPWLPRSVVAAMILVAAHRLLRQLARSPRAGVPTWAPVAYQAWHRCRGGRAAQRCARSRAIPPVLPAHDVVAADAAIAVISRNCHGNQRLRPPPRTGVGLARGAFWHGAARRAQHCGRGRPQRGGLATDPAQCGRRRTAGRSWLRGPDNPRPRPGWLRGGCIPSAMGTASSSSSTTDRWVKARTSSGRHGGSMSAQPLCPSQIVRISQLGCIFVGTMHDQHCELGFSRCPGFLSRAWGGRLSGCADLEHRRHGP